MAAPANAEARSFRLCRITAGVGTTERSEGIFEVDNDPEEIKKPEGTVDAPMPLDGKVFFIKKEASPTETLPKQWSSVPLQAKTKHLLSVLAKGPHDLRVQLLASEPNPEDVTSVFYYEQSICEPHPTVSEMDTGNDNPADRKFQLAFLRLKKEEDQTKIDAIMGETYKAGNVRSYCLAPPGAMAANAEARPDSIRYVTLSNGKDESPKLHLEIDNAQKMPELERDPMHLEGGILFIKKETLPADIQPEKRWSVSLSLGNFLSTLDFFQDMLSMENVQLRFSASRDNPRGMPLIFYYSSVVYDDLEAANLIQCWNDINSKNNIPCEPLPVSLCVSFLGMSREEDLTKVFKRLWTK